MIVPVQIMNLGKDNFMSKKGIRQGYVEPITQDGKILVVNENNNGNKLVETELKSNTI